MPMRSQAQRRWMWANKPEMAKRWEEHTPKNKKLPEKIAMEQQRLSLNKKEIMGMARHMNNHMKAYRKAGGKDERGEATRGFQIYLKNNPHIAKRFEYAARLREQMGHQKNAFWNGFKKQAGLKPGDVAELAGLGTLAVPSVAHLAGHDMSENTKSVMEIGGLGTLAAPYVYKGLKGLAKRKV